MKLIMLALIFVVSGCASTKVAQIGPDTYFVQREAGAGTFGTAGLRMEAIEDANKHCQRMGKKAVVLSMNENPSVMSYPSADVQFRCLDEGDKDLQRPTLEKSAAPAVTIIR